MQIRESAGWRMRILRIDNRNDMVIRIEFIVYPVKYPEGIKFTSKFYLMG